MHINARGHRPLTSPFSRGRGSGLCVIGFNELSTVSYTFLQYIQCGSHFLPHCTHSSLSVCPLAITNHRRPERDAWTSQHYPVSACSCLHCSSSLPHLFQPLLLSKPYLCDPSFMLHYFQNKIQSFNRPCRERCDLFCVNHFVKAAWR